MNKKKEQNRLLCIILAVFASSVIHVQAQNAITHEHNGIRLGDRVEKQQVEYVNPGESGENTVWDFSDASAIKSHPTVFFCDSDSIEIIELQPVSISKYSFSADSLLLTSYENPLQSVRYTQPLAQLAYPFHLGQSFVQPYSGAGLYCNTQSISTYGTMDVEADGMGKLIVSEGDTLSNVLRIHSVRTGSLLMQLDVDSLGFDSEAVVTDSSFIEADTAQAPAIDYGKQEIEERYQWYARGYRYPIFETISTSYYDNLDLVSCIQAAYMCVPSQQKLLDDKANEDVQREDSLLHLQNNAPDIMHYSVSTDGHLLKIRYSLSESASITTLLCNHRGMSFCRSSCAMPAGENYEISLNCSGLQPDMYILYINVNGKVYSEKINVM